MGQLEAKTGPQCHLLDNKIKLREPWWDKKSIFITRPLWPRNSYRYHVTGSPKFEWQYLIHYTHTSKPPHTIFHMNARIWRYKWCWNNFGTIIERVYNIRYLRDRHSQITLLRIITQCIGQFDDEWNQECIWKIFYSCLIKSPQCTDKCSKKKFW